MRATMTDIDSSLELHSGGQIPLIGLGTWKLTNDTAETVRAAIDLGYRMIDTSGDYGTQPGIGKAIRRSDVDREELYIVTKVEEDEDAYKSVHHNLDELGLDYADLILIHRPPSFGAGEDLWKGLIRAKEEGLTLDIGVSNYRTNQIEALIEATGEVPVVNQLEWSPFGHSKNMLEYCQENEIVILAYSPLTHSKMLHNKLLKKLSERYGKTPAQIILRWDIQQEIVPLPKANKRNHLKENLDIFDFEISERDMGVLSSLNEYYSMFGSLPYI